MELALWTLKIASMVPVLLRFASIALLAASRPPTAKIMGGQKLTCPIWVQTWPLAARV